jgi:hypothetical protein
MYMNPEEASRICTVDWQSDTVYIPAGSHRTSPYELCRCVRKTTTTTTISDFVWPTYLHVLHPVRTFVCVIFGRVVVSSMITDDYQGDRSSEALWLELAYIGLHR